MMLARRVKEQKGLHKKGKKEYTSTKVHAHEAWVLRTALAERPVGRFTGRGTQGVHSQQASNGALHEGVRSDKASVQKRASGARVRCSPDRKIHSHICTQVHFIRFIRLRGI
jgi:hypothetical protein